MKASALAIRAITAEYVRQLIQPFVWVGVGVGAILLVSIGGLAATYSPWWWIAALPVITLAVIGLCVWLVVRQVIRTIAPLQTAEQTTTSKQFVAKTKRLSDTISTPYWVIIFRLVKDLLTRRTDGYVYELTQDSKTLHTDFLAVRRAFEENNRLVIENKQN